MALTKRTRFILVQSTRNANVTEDNLEPYHISIFRRSTSMPPLPKRSLSTRKTHFLRREQRQQSPDLPTRVIPKNQSHEKDETSTNKFYKLNIHAMKKKSARISMRLSSAFGLSAHTIDEQFNFQEQRFRAIEKFLKLFLRNTYISIETLRENFITQVDVAEDFEELLGDKMPDLVQQFIRLKRSLLENTFTEFYNHIDLHVIQPLTTLLKLFISPVNLITKRHNKLLDYDCAQLAYDKVKDQQLTQAKQALNQSKQAYDVLNNRLLEDLPVLYERSGEIISLCLKEFLRAHLHLIQQMRTNIHLLLNQMISPRTIDQLNWQQILDRFISKTNPIGEQFFQLTITAKNFSERLKNLSTVKVSLGTTNPYNSDKETSIQTDEIRQLIKNRYPEKDLFTVIEDYTNSRLQMTVQNGDLVSIIHQYDGDNTDLHCFVDNGVTQGYLPRSILMPFSSVDQTDLNSSAPPIPKRYDIPVPSRTPLPLPRASRKSYYNQLDTILTRAETQSELCLFNSAHQDNERTYLNQIDIRSSTIETNEYHQYDSIDLDDPPVDVSHDQERIYIALYDFNCTADGVLSLCVGERLRILRRSDGDENTEWWYVEKVNDITEKGYVPANYIQAV